MEANGGEARLKQLMSLITTNTQKISQNSKKLGILEIIKTFYLFFSF